MESVSVKAMTHRRKHCVRYLEHYEPGACGSNIPRKKKKKNAVSSFCWCKLKRNISRRCSFTWKSLTGETWVYFYYYVDTVVFQCLQNNIFCIFGQRVSGELSQGVMEEGEGAATVSCRRHACTPPTPQQVNQLLSHCAFAVRRLTPCANRGIIAFFIKIHFAAPGMLWNAVLNHQKLLELQDWHFEC